YRSAMTKVLLVGADGRSDCIADAIVRGGGTVHALATVKDHPGLRRKAAEVRSCVVADPETVVAFALARIESSKSFTRALLDRHDIPGRIAHRVFTAETVDGIEAYFRELGAFVVKADGLMGGKGVKVFGDQLTSIEESVAYARSLVTKGPVVVEEKIEGEEFSLQSLCDGASIVHTIPVQDHKRAYEGDTGPNTGGMGSYSAEDHALPFLRPQHVAAAREINARVVMALQDEVGEPYRGVLYGGFMATGRDVRLLEYNARFGDPEAMNVIPLLEGNFLDLCLAIATGRLASTNVTFRRQATVCKYLVPRGYPDAPVKNETISLASLPSSTDALRVYFAALRDLDRGLVMTGSRAVAVVALADSISRAAELAEQAIAGVDGPVEHRRDIGMPVLLARRVEHLATLSART